MSGVKRGLTTSGGPLGLQALAEVGCDLPMAEEAECSDIVQVALAASFGYWEDVVGIPQAAAGGDGLHPVEAQTCSSRSAAGAFECGVYGYGVGVAGGADSAIASEDLIAEVAGVGAEAPLVNTVVAAEGATTPGDDLKLAPAAERQAVWSLGQGFASGVASLECSRHEHGLRILLNGIPER